MSSTLIIRLSSIGVLFAIWIMSFLPGSLIPSLPGTDKWHHALAYFTGMFCWGQWFLSPSPRLKLAVVFILMGAAIECLQGLTSYRSFEWLDIAADTFGVIFGWFVVTVQLAVKRRFVHGIEQIRSS